MKRIAHKTMRAQCGGFARARKYPPQKLSEWAARGGNALLRKYGPNYFRELKRKQSQYPRYEVWQASYRVAAAKWNGQKGGLRRAENHSAEQLRAWARLGGIAVKNRYGSEHFKKLGKRSAEVWAERERKYKEQLAELELPYISTRKRVWHW